MSRNLSLHHLCAMEVDAETLVDIASRTGFQHVCLFVETPEGMSIDVPLVTEAPRKALRARMDDAGKTALNTEVVVLTPTTDIAAFKRFFIWRQNWAARPARLSSLTKMRDE